jgi:hypothetical protein
MKKFITVIGILCLGLVMLFGHITLMDAQKALAIKEERLAAQQKISDACIYKEYFTVGILTFSCTQLFVVPEE